MTVGSNLNESAFVGDGVLEAFTFNFDCGPGGNRVSTDEIAVYLIDAITGVPVKQSGYTVAFNSSTVGGIVTLASIPALGIAGVIRRELNFKQTQAFNLSANLDERAIEKMGDRATFELQDVLQRSSRAIQMPFGTSNTFNGQIAGKATQGSTVLAQLGIDGSVSGFFFSDVNFEDLATQVAADAASADASATSAAASAVAAAAAAATTITIPGNSQLLVPGGNVARTLVNLLSDNGNVIHSRSIKQVHHEGGVNSCSGFYKMYLNAFKNPNQFYTFIVDADDAGAGIQIGEDVPPFNTTIGQVTGNNAIGNLNVTGIQWISGNTIRYKFSGNQWVTSTVYAAGAVVSNPIAPQWVTATVYGAGATVRNGENLYTTTAGGTSGATAPTGSGTISDGGVTWVYTSAAYRIYRTVAGGTSGATAPTQTSGSFNDGGVLWAYVGAEPSFSAVTGTVISNGSAVLTVGNAANEPNQGIFKVTALNNTAGIKTVDVTNVDRSDATLDESGSIVTQVKVGGIEPVYMPSNSRTHFRARINNLIFSQYNFCWTTCNPSTDGGTVTTNAHTVWEGGYIAFVTHTQTQSQKGFGWGNVDIWSEIGYQTTGNTAGSFSWQARSATRGYVIGGNGLSGDTTGEDGRHISRNSWDIEFTGLNIESGDDAFSITQENGGGTYTCRDIRILASSLRSKQNSSFKCLIDSSSAALGSSIKGIEVIGCHLGLHNATTAGSNVRVTSLPGFEELISDIIIDDFTSDSTSGTLNSTSFQLDYCSRVSITRGKMRGLLRNGVIMNGGIDHRIEDNEIGFPTAQTSVTDVSGFTITGITKVSGTTYKVQFDTAGGGPDLSTVGSTFTFITIPSGTTNFNRTYITGTVDNTLKTINITVGAKNATLADETGLTATGGYIRKQGGEQIVCAGGDGHFIKNNRSFMSYLDAGSKIICNKNFVLTKTDTNGSNVLNPTPTNMQCEFNTIKNQVAEDAFDIQQCINSSFSHNRSKNSTGRFMIGEGTSSTNDSNRFVDNRDDGTVQYDVSYQFSKATSIARGNRGTNSDRVRLSVTIPSGSTSVTINIPDGFTAPSGTNVASVSGGFTRGFGASFIEPRLLRVTPTLYSSAKNYRVGYNSGTRNMTITTDVDPSTGGFTADCELSTDPQF